MLNNLDSVVTSINPYPQNFIIATVNNPPTIDAPAFPYLVGEFFQVLELEFSLKSFEIFLQLTTFFR